MLKVKGRHVEGGQLGWRHLAEADDASGRRPLAWAASVAPLEAAGVTRVNGSLFGVFLGVISLSNLSLLKLNLFWD